MQNWRKRKSSPQTAICFQRSRHARAQPFIFVAVFSVNRHKSASYQHVIKITIQKPKQHASRLILSKHKNKCSTVKLFLLRVCASATKAYCDTCRLGSQSHKNVRALVLWGPNFNRLTIHFGPRLMVKETRLDKPSRKLSYSRQLAQQYALVI